MSTRFRFDPGQWSSAPGRQCSRAPIPFVRANVLAPFVDFIGSIGAPVERFLGEAQLVPSLLDDAEALVPTFSIFRFVEIAAVQERVEDLGAIVGQRASSFDLGAYGGALQESTTAFEYLRRGISLVGAHSNGTRFWLTRERGVLRVNQHLVGPPSRGRCIGDVFTLVITLNMLRRFLGPAWAPGEVRLLAGDEALVGDRAVFGEAQLITGQRHTSFTIDASLGGLPVWAGIPAEAPAQPVDPAPGPSMPADFKASVEQLVRSLMIDGRLDIDTAAEASGMSPRTLQRRLAESGLTYAGLVSTNRFRLAKTWLEESDLPIGEIANLLGYTAATNFARAFRRHAGISPAAYRRGRVQG